MRISKPKWLALQMVILALIAGGFLLIQPRLVQALPTSPAAMSGQGVVGDRYLVTTCEDLQALNNGLDKYYELANDIDCSASSTWNGGAGFIPIGNDNSPFVGSIDGKGHTITGLYIDQSGASQYAIYTGLFGKIAEYATILNLHVVDGTIIGNGTNNNSAATGGIIGQMNSGNVSRVSFSGTISVPNCSAGHAAGGVIGSASRLQSFYTTLNQLSSTGSLTVEASDCSSFADMFVGGLMGYNSEYLMYDSYSTIDIMVPVKAGPGCGSTNCRYIGGLIGATGTDTAGIASSYYAGTITLTRTPNQHLGYALGGLIGYQYENVNLDNVYAGATLVAPSACDDLECGAYGQSIGAVVGDNDGLSASDGGDWNNVVFDQNRAVTPHCADTSPDSNYRCINVNDDGLDPAYFQGSNPGNPYAYFDAAVWEPTSEYPRLKANTQPQGLAPINLSAVIESTTSITVSWEPGSTPTQGYYLMCRKVGTTAWSYCTNYIEATSATINNLQQSTQYEFRVVADIRDSYLSDPSQSLFATTATPGFEQISDCEDLQNVNNDLSKNYELTRNIDCSASIAWNDGTGFEPLGFFDYTNGISAAYTGVFKGNNYTISSLYIDQTESTSGNLGTALFSVTSNAIIQDLKLSSPTVKGGFAQGSLVGSAFGTTIINSHVTDATLIDPEYASGGLVAGMADGGLIERSSVTGSLYSSNPDAISYVGGFMASTQNLGDTPDKDIVLNNNYSQLDMTLENGAYIAGGFIGYAITGDSNGNVNSFNKNYSSGSLNILANFTPSPDPNLPNLGGWIAGSFSGAVVGGSLNDTSLTNNFSASALQVSGLQTFIGNFISFGFSTSDFSLTTYPGDLSSNYFDSDQSGSNLCITNLTSSCNPITGQPDYFKNNSTNPPLNTWDFTNIWRTTTSYPEFAAASTTTITTVPPERLTPGGGTTPPQPGATAGDDAQTVAPATTSTTPRLATSAGESIAQEAGVLGAIKNFVRSLPTIVVVAFPYALFGLILAAALLLAIELFRELRRARALEALIGKQRKLAEERDAFWHLAANYLRAPITLIVGGAEALHESHAGQTPINISVLATALQVKVSDIMKKIEGSVSLQAISKMPAGIKRRTSRSLAFILPVSIVGGLVVLANYAASSWRDLSPGVIGYISQAAIFVIVALLFYWALDMLGRGKSRRQAAEFTLRHQTADLNNARHELINDTVNSLGPDLTKLEGLIKQLPASTAQTAPGALATLHDGVDRLRGIVSNFALLIKVQENSGHVNATQSRIDLTNILQSVRAKLTPEITAKGVRVTAPALSLPVTAESDMAKQVIESIVSNAIDYSPTNGTVSIEAQRLNDAIQLRISDQGKGISKDQLEHLFQPFTRADGTSAMDMSHGGFGINLYLDKLIMEQLGGSIKADSNPGKGTSVTITWPAS